MTQVITVDVRPPTLDTASIMFDIALNSRAVDTYPEYFYLTMCRDFAATSLVAHEGGRAIAYALPYAKHEDPGVLYIRQLAAIQEPRSRGVAQQLIRSLIDNRRDDLAYVEATIDLDNTIIYNVLSKIANEYGVVMKTYPLYEDHHFTIDHRPEHLVKIGPFGEQV